MQQVLPEAPVQQDSLIGQDPELAAGRTEGPRWELSDSHLAHHGLLSTHPMHHGTLLLQTCLLSSSHGCPHLQEGQAILQPSPLLLSVPLSPLYLAQWAQASVTGMGRRLLLPLGP